ncbi:transcription factor grauzone-like [Sabethes cyaneus]|uniref:transcription factor grauzone-like n=1 Tax=Sabethes cyaneus TaxID=53552 RepID=UPI00237ED722|nr:transcription factor grauzone-like [Sabethes cyaneus]
MEPTSKEGCRLCLDLFAENFCSITSEELQKQISKVFHFAIEIMDGFPTAVCQSCAYTVSEFFQYSEKVRLNQEKLMVELSGEKKVDQAALEETKLIVDLKDEQQIEAIMLAETKFDVSDDWIDETAPEVDKLSEKSVESVCSPDEPDETLNTSDRSSKRPRTQKSERKCRKVAEKTRKNTVRSKKEREQENETINSFFQMNCDMCGESFANVVTLKAHFRKQHDTSGYVVCCGKKIYVKSSMINHIALHQDPDAFRCKLCNKSYKNKEYFTQHQQTVHGSEGETAFRCDTCGLGFDKQYTLRAHTTKYHEKVKCPHCDKQLANKFVLKNHIVFKHQNTDRQMICDVCGREFLNKQFFDRHILAHKGIETKSFQCQICQKWLKGERNFQQHLQYVHYEAGKSHICSICKQNYPNSRALYKHKSKVHVEEKYECEFCGRKFKQALYLKFLFRNIEQPTQGNGCIAVSFAIIL